VAENGAYVRERENEILVTPLNNNTIQEVLNLLNGVTGVHTVLCGKTNAYINGESRAFRQKLREYYSEYSVVDDLAAFDGQILKIALYHFQSSEQHIYPIVKHLESSLKVKVSGENWLDISEMNANKGYALQKLQELYGINKGETMVFGDYNNDLEMLAMGHFSYAMANAHPNVKAIANYSTASNDEMGVEQVLDELLRS